MTVDMPADVLALWYLSHALASVGSNMASYLLALHVPLCGKLCPSCAQMALPTYSLHVRLILPCAQRPLPPHSLHLFFLLPCTQMLLPPHSLQWYFCLPWRQMLLPPHALQLYF